MPTRLGPQIVLQHFFTGDVELVQLVKQHTTKSPCYGNSTVMNNNQLEYIKEAQYCTNQILIESAHSRINYSLAFPLLHTKVSH